MANQAAPPIVRQTPKPARSGFDWAKFFTYFVLVLGAVIAIVPFLATISISLMNLTEATSQTFIPSTPQWGNYVEAWQEADFSEFFFNSLQIALITVAGEVVFGVLAAYAFARMNFPGKNLLFGLFLSTLTLPAAIVWVPNFLTVSWLGKVTPFQWIDNWPALTVPFMASAFGIFYCVNFSNKFQMSCGILLKLMALAICAIYCKLCCHSQKHPFSFWRCLAFWVAGTV